MSNASSIYKKNIDVGFIIFATMAYIIGIGLCILLALRMWLPLYILLGVITILPIVWLSIRHPDFIIFLGLILNFTPLHKGIGYYLIIFLTVVLFCKNVILRIKIVKFDTITSLWCLIAGISLLTLPKWVNYYRGIQGYVPLLILPMVLFIIINHGYLSYKAIERFFYIYIPIIFTYMVIQILYLIISGTAVKGSSWMYFHAGFDVGWGRTVFLAALLTFFSFLTIQTRSFWARSMLISSFVYFDIIVSAICIILIMARAPMVSLVLSLLIFYLFWKHYCKKDINIKISYFLYGFVLIGISYLLFNKFINTLVMRFIIMKRDPSFLIRLYIYKQGIDTFVNNMFWGYGPNQYMFDNRITYDPDPNNVFLSYAVSFGILGLIVISIIFIMPYIKMMKLYKLKTSINKKYLGTLLLPVLTLSIINSCMEVVMTSYIYSMIFWTVYALFYRMYDYEIVGK